MMKKVESNDAVWPEITQEERRSHEILFYSQGPLDGYLIGERARDLFLHSGLRLTVLSQIWNLADVSNDNLLNVDEFVLAAHLIQGVLQGRPVPKSLPENLVPKASLVIPLPQLSDSEREAYSKIFQSYDSSRKGLMNCIDARELLLASKLSVEQLAEVWDISDVNRDGSLDVDEWTVACQLVRLLKQGQSLEASINPFTYLSDRISPTSLHARKIRVDQYEKQKQRLMQLKEKRKNQAVRENRRLDLLKEKSGLEKDLYNKLKSLGKCSLSEEEFNKIITQDANDIEKLEEIVIRLKKEHEKIRQETVKVILGEQKLQVEFQSIKRETDELAKRLSTEHTKATKDPDPFHQLYEQLKEERKKSNLSEGEEPEIHLPFKISPFDKEGLNQKTLSGANIFMNPQVIDNNNVQTSDENQTIIETLYEFDDKLIETWSSPKARRESATSSDVMEGEVTAIEEEKDEIFMTDKEHDTHWLKWSDDTLLGTNDKDLEELQRKLIDLKTEMQKLNSDAGGRLVFRNQSDYLARKKAKEEEEQQEKSKYPRRSKSSVDTDYAAKRRSYNIDKRKEELDSAREKRLNRRSLNIDLSSNTEGEKTKSRAPDRPARPPSIRNSDITSDSSIKSAPERPKRGRTSSQEVKSADLSPAKTSTPLTSPRKSVSPATSPTRSTKKTRAPEPPVSPSSITQSASPFKESKIPVITDTNVTPVKESKIPVLTDTKNSTCSSTPERPPRRKKKSTSDSEPSSPRSTSIIEISEQQITSPEPDSFVLETKYEKSLNTVTAEVVVIEDNVVEAKLADVKSENFESENNKNQFKPELELPSTDNKVIVEIHEPNTIDNKNIDIQSKSVQKQEEIVDEVVIPVKRNIEKSLPPLEKFDKLSSKSDEKSPNLNSKEVIDTKLTNGIVDKEPESNVVGFLVESDEIELEEPIVTKLIDVKDKKRNLDDDEIITNGDIDFDISKNFTKPEISISDKDNFEDNDSFLKDESSDVGLLESIVQSLDYSKNKNNLLNDKADRISLTPSVGSETDSLPPLPDTAPPILSFNGSPEEESEEIIEEQVITVVSTKPVHTEIITSDRSSTEPLSENSFSKKNINSNSKMSGETVIETSTPSVNGLKSEDNAPADDNLSGLDVYMNDFKLEAKLKREALEEEEEDDSDLSDMEGQNGFEAMFTPGEHGTGHVATTATDEEDDGGIQLISFNTTSTSIQSPGESQTDSAFEDMISSMHSNDADHSNQVSLSNTLDDVQDSMVVENFESVKTSFEESQPAMISPPQTPRMSCSALPKVPPENRPTSPPDPSKTPRDTSSIVKKANQFSESLNRPPKVTIRASSEDMSEQRLQELDAERRAVINLSKQRFIMDESDEEEAVPPSVEVTNGTAWNSEEGSITFGKKIDLDDKPDKVDLYGQNIISEQDTSESVDRESIADLASTRKQWENLYYSSARETTPKVTPQKSSTVKHWEVKLPYKPSGAVTVDSQITPRSPSPPAQIKMETVSSNNYENESAIEREIRLANEREQMLRREQEEREELMKRQNASKQQVNVANFENNNNTEFKTMYHEMTEADRGSEMIIRETMIQQELDEQREREKALVQKSKEDDNEKTEEIEPTASTESLIAEEIKLQRQREEEISKRYNKDNVQEDDVIASEQVNGDINKELNYEEAIASNQHEGESLIARELRETREREEELQRQRERLLKKDAPKEQEQIIEQEPPKMMAVKSPPVQSVQSSKSYTTPRSSSQASRSVKVTPIVDSNSDDENEPKEQTKKPETPIEREIRLARERENELRKMKGLPVLEVPKEPEPEPAPITPTSSKSESYIYKRLGGNQSNTMRNFASSRLQNELMKQKERENAYRQEGRIITTSEDHIDASKYSEMAGIVNDGPVKRNFVTRKSVSGASDGERTPSENGDIELPKQVKSPPTPQQSSKEPKFGRSISGTGGAVFSYRESSQKAESKIERELREMKEREEELRQSRMGSGMSSPNNPDSPREMTKNSNLSLAAQWEQKYSK